MGLIYRVAAITTDSICAWRLAILALSNEPLATLRAEQKKKAEKDKNRKVFIVFPLETGKHYCPPREYVSLVG